ncbi:MAG: hypothetical protein WBP75_07060 [Candidatus Cybelea sp.]
MLVDIDEIEAVHLAAVVIYDEGFPAIVEDEAALELALVETDLVTVVQHTLRRAVGVWVRCKKVIEAPVFLNDDHYVRNRTGLGGRRL